MNVLHPNTNQLKFTTSPVLEITNDHVWIMKI